MVFKTMKLVLGHNNDQRAGRRGDMAKDYICSPYTREGEASRIGGTSTKRAPGAKKL